MIICLCLLVVNIGMRNSRVFLRKSGGFSSEQAGRCFQDFFPWFPDNLYFLMRILYNQ